MHQSTVILVLIFSPKQTKKNWLVIDGNGPNHWADLFNSSTSIRSDQYCYWLIPKQRYWHQYLESKSFTADENKVSMTKLSGSILFLLKSFSPLSSWRSTAHRWGAGAVNMETETMRDKIKLQLSTEVKGHVFALHFYGQIPQTSQRYPWQREPSVWARPMMRTSQKACFSDSQRATGGLALWLH